MQFTFKHQGRQRSLPFLQRFKNKINRVDRASGLVGALGLAKKHNVQKITNKTRFYTEANQHKLSIQLSKKSNSVHNHSRIADIVVNRFKTHPDEDHDLQQNIDTNLNYKPEQEFKKPDYYQGCQRQSHIDKLQRKTTTLKALILPKIAGTSVDVTDPESQMKLRRTKQYEKYRNMKLATRREIPSAFLR